ncbi:MAG: AI-2E family transporter [Acidobacteria bacterium]|nr:AI-2E family transporter [Acidobacteriota bacterium]
MATNKVEEVSAQVMGGPTRQPPPVSPAEPAKPRRRASDSQSAAQVVIAVAIVLAICYLAKLVLIVLLVSILFAFMLGPIVESLERVRIPRPVGSFFDILLVLGMLWGLTYFFYNRAVSFAQDLPKYSHTIRASLGKVRQQASVFQKTTQEVLPESPQEKGTVRVQQTSNWGDSLTHSAGAVWEVALSISFIPFLVYFMLTWQEHARAATVMLFRLENRNTAYVTLGRISSMIRSFLLGNLLIGVVLSILSAGIFAVLKLPYFYFLAVISGFLSLVPYLGVVLAMVPPVTAGFGHLHGTGLMVVVLSVLVLHLFAINVLYPKFIGRRLQLNPLVVTISLLVWGWIWGAMGLILAVPITGALKVIFDHIESLRAYGAWLGE